MRPWVARLTYVCVAPNIWPIQTRVRGGLVNYRPNRRAASLAVVAAKGLLLKVTDALVDERRGCGTRVRHWLIEGRPRGCWRFEGTVWHDSTGASVLWMASRGAQDSFSLLKGSKIPDE